MTRTLARKLTRTVAICVLAALTAAPLASARTPANPEKPTGKKQCFYTRLADSFAAPDEENLYIRVGVKDVYHFTMFARCTDIDWNQHLTLVSRSGSWICSGMDADVITHTNLGPERCAVRYVNKLTPEEVAALPKRARP